MKSLRVLVYLYMALITLLLIALIFLIVFSDNANYPPAWTESSVATILDMIKVVVGGAVGTLGAAAAMVFDRGPSK